MTSPRKGARLGVATLAIALIATGCASSGDDAHTSGGMTEEQIYETGVYRTEAGDPVDGGTLTVAGYAEARSLDPTETYANGASGGSALAAVYDVLMRYNPETDEFEPKMAESLLSEDNRTWTLQLRDDVEFSDGTPVNAAAVVSSIEYYLANQGHQALVLHQNLADMAVENEQTVMFTLHQPWSTFPNMLAAGPGMIMAPAAHVGEKFTPIGAGPFELERYSPSEELVLSSREDYWNGAPHLDTLRFIWLGNDDIRVEAMDSGEVHVAYLRSISAVEDARRSGYPGYMSVVGLGSMVWINNREGRAGSDVRVRRAIAHALDPGFYSERTHEGRGMPSKQVFAENSPWFTGVEPPEHDVEKAKELVEEAKADGFDGTLVYVGQSDQTSRAGALAAKAMLEKRASRWSWTSCGPSPIRPHA